MTASNKNPNRNLADLAAILCVFAIVNASLFTSSNNRRVARQKISARRQAGHLPRNAKTCASVLHAAVKYTQTRPEKSGGASSSRFTRYKYVLAGDRTRYRHSNSQTMVCLSTS